jgi:hypothetical protein
MHILGLRSVVHSETHKGKKEKQFEAPNEECRSEIH